LRANSRQSFVVAGARVSPWCSSFNAVILEGQQFGDGMRATMKIALLFRKESLNARRLELPGTA
jgi:hypothetical protein